MKILIIDESTDGEADTGAIPIELRFESRTYCFEFYGNASTELQEKLIPFIKGHLID